MLFPADVILEVCTRGFQSEHVPHIVLRLLGDGPQEEDRPKLLIAFLETLPPPDKQWKILKRLRKLALASEAEIDDFLWWGIGAVSKELTLMATVKRDRRVIQVLFMWKKMDEPKATDSDKASLNKGSDYHGWARDTAAPNGWRYEFQVPTYREAKTYFADWLARPLPPLPHAEPGVAS